MILPGPLISQQPQGTAGSAQYQISFDRLEKLKRSPAFLLASRLDPDSPSSHDADREDVDPQGLVEEIADRYSGYTGFIVPELPIQELIFRILLVRRNEPISLHELQLELTERWATPVRPINVTQAGLKRILDADTYYGFAPAPSAE